MPAGHGQCLCFDRERVFDLLMEQRDGVLGGVIGPVREIVAAL